MGEVVPPIRGRDDITDEMVGRRYRVVMQDCCVAGRFVATVAEIARNDGSDHEEDLGFIEAVIFDNGVTLEEFNGVAFEEVGWWVR